jgi:glycosyltransferase involved in cell wall biosynthesis
VKSHLRDAPRHSMIDMPPYARDPIDKRAIDRFKKTYPSLKLAGVCVLIPAFEEEGSIAHVIASVPAKICGLPTSVVVIVDGGKDSTADIVLHAGERVYGCICGRNRGQGAALRLGYRLALMYGADYIVTVDADGQWDPKQMKALIQPLVDDEADFVQGSRRLGQYNNRNFGRALGVHVFAALINLLMRVNITDSSSGFRAFKSKVVKHLSLQQDQYQAAELLIEVLASGFTVVEVPVTMNKRTAGTSNKGSFVSYGMHYAKAILTTWSRCVRNK